MPAVPQPADLTAAQWNYIKSTMVTESQAGGRLNGCQWTDAAGNARTSSIIDVRRSHHLFTAKMDPKKVDVRTVGVVGVQLADYNPQAYASNRQWLINQFDILIAVNSVDQTIGSDELPANGDDALAQAWSFVSDGNGNGIAEIFRQPTNWTLGGTCMSVDVSRGVPILDPQPGSTPQIWGYVTLTLTTRKILGLL